MKKPDMFTDLNDDPSYPLAAVCFAGGVGAAWLTKRPAFALGGTVFSGLYGYSGYEISQRQLQGHGLETGAATSAAMALATAPRAVKTAKALPMFVTTFSVLNLAYYGRKIYDRQLEL